MTTYSFANSAINKIIDNKANLAIMAEKAHFNVKLKMQHNSNIQQRIHYFAVGHSFKNIDRLNLFDEKQNKETGEYTCSRFKKIRFHTEFNFYGRLVIYVNRIRSLNSHYLHELKNIRFEDINSDDKDVIEFLCESFKAAVILSFIKEKKITLEYYFGGDLTDTIVEINKEKIERIKKNNSEVVSFLSAKFYTIHELKEGPTEEQKNAHQ